MGKPEKRSSATGAFAWAATIVLAAVVVWMGMRFHPKPTSARNACFINLRQLNEAKQEWALECGKTNGEACTEKDIKPYIKLNGNGEISGCPQGGIYTIGKVGELPTCSLATNGLPGHRLP